ncbi:Uncharacterized protein ACMD2_00737 [Ananas comosus]|uniref:Calcineurin-like phosphoesterase domain-containing protein n=1 Tax=Ananas comosus TaxID=4615 RepID=A0A199V4F2_ANACO|nr:Uncharacterized protein ACMD2_00737 [Ananas comosus]
MESPDPICGGVPPLVASFVDTFVDYCVSGLFFPTNPNPNPNANPNPDPPPTRFPPAARLVAIGDLHGDLHKAREALSLAGLSEPSSSAAGASRWCGGATVAVQVGDVLDRGGDEIRLLYLLHRLKLDAARHGGALLTVLGNHEVMNVAGDFRYATPAGLDEFASWARWFRAGLAMKRLVPDLPPPRDPFRGVPTSFPGIKPEFWEGLTARIAALRPEGPISARFLAENHTVLVVGDSVFVHGGLLESHVEHGLETINEEVREWIRGARPRAPAHVRGRDAVVWLRKFSEDGEGKECDCTHLKDVLGRIPGTRRMVMGHTIQKQGITAACGEQAVRIDVGLSRGCGDGAPQVLEIGSGGNAVRVLATEPATVVGRWGVRRREDEVAKEGLAMLVKESGTGLREVEARA